jgi:homocysteine S-methyltransferase
MADSLFLEALDRRVMLGDGAYGTEFIRRGIPSGQPMGELNLKKPQIVLDLHREYVAAGAELLKTNTFTANRLRLAPAGLESKVREINVKGAQLAREAGRDAFVAGSVGPLTEFPWKQREEAYREQCEALAEGGCDVLLFETFQNLDDLLKALGAATPTGLPLIGQIATQEVLRYTRMIHEAAGPEAMGVNCVTAEQALQAVRRLKEAGCRLTAFPSAGPPWRIFPAEVFAKGILTLVEAGARLVGGCCGAGPDHIRAAAAALGRPR